MAAPRATHLVVVRNLARSSHQTRQLHMTSPATYAPKALSKERTELSSTRTQADEPTHSRSFSTSIAQSRRPKAEQKAAPKVVRHFNTSRTLKAVNDASTIDFAYMPQVDTDNMDAAMIRVPILPDNYSVAHAPAVAEQTVVLKPQISSMSADQVYLPMHELHDGHAMGIDFHAMADRVAANVRRMKLPVEEQAGLMKRIWNDMVDDMTGAGKKHAAT